MSRKIPIDYDFLGVGRILNLQDAESDQEPVTLSQLRSYFVERRHEWSDPFDYLGKAPLGTSDATPIWSITRLTVSSTGVVTERATATGVTWRERADHTYI